MDRSADAIVALCVGDTPMFTATVRPRYLEHESLSSTRLTSADERFGYTPEAWNRFRLTNGSGLLGMLG